MLPYQAEIDSILSREQARAIKQADRHEMQAIKRLERFREIDRTVREIMRFERIDSAIRYS